jgi:uncharacterized protein DUF6894
VARYFFYTNAETQGDHEGMEFESLSAAKCEAVRFAGRLICDGAEHFWDTNDFEMTVTNEAGLILFTMRFVGTEAPAIRASSH